MNNEQWIVMGNNIVKNKSFSFALKIVDLQKTLIEKREYIISKQIMRSGTSIGANIRESEYAESKADFIHKLSIALKEANETEYWLELLFYSQTIDEELFKKLQMDLKELLRLLISSIKSSKRNLRKS